MSIFRAMPTDPDTAPAGAGAPAGGRPPVVLVTGPSGAGRSTVIAALEDLGFEAIDNLPLSLLPRLLERAPEGALALGLDARNRDFEGRALIAAAQGLGARPDLAAETLYLDCRAEVLLRRYAETRRRHPMAADGDPATGVAREAAALAGLRERASALIDTSEMTPHELRAEIARRYGARARGPGAGGGAPAVVLASFSYRRGIPAGIDTALDCRLLRNPHWEPSLRERDGTDPEVAAYVGADPRYGAFLDAALALARLILPARDAHGRAPASMGLGCTGGQHRSVAVAEAVARALAADGVGVSIRHRELERRTAAGSPHTHSEGSPAGRPDGRPDGRPHPPRGAGAGPDGGLGAAPGRAGRGAA